jgi:Spore Coat Protein U domain
MRRFSALLAGLAMLALMAPTASFATTAGTQVLGLLATGDVPVIAIVTGGCSIASSGLNFGELDAILVATTPFTTFGTIGFLCSENPANLSFGPVPLEAAVCLDAGGNGPSANAIGANRAMTDGTDFIGYQVFDGDNFLSGGAEIGTAITNCVTFANLSQGLVTTLPLVGVTLPTQPVVPEAGEYDDDINVFFVLVNAG